MVSYSAAISACEKGRRREQAVVLLEEMSRIYQPKKGIARYIYIYILGSTQVGWLVGWSELFCPHFLENCFGHPIFEIGISFV